MGIHSAFGLSIAASWLVPFVVVGCTISAETDPTLKFSPLVEPLPTVIGVHYSERIRNYRFEAAIGTIHTYTFAPGPSSIPIFDQIFDAMFERKIGVKSLPSAGRGGPDRNAVIAPEIVDFSVSDQDVSVSITYAITLYSPIGEELGAWTVGGTGTPDLDTLFTQKAAAQATEYAIRDATAKFLTVFYQEPFIKSCLTQDPSRAAAEESVKCFSWD